MAKRDGWSGRPNHTGGHVRVTMTGNAVVYLLFSSHNVTTISPFSTGSFVYASGWLPPDSPERRLHATRRTIPVPVPVMRVPHEIHNRKSPQTVTASPGMRVGTRRYRTAVARTGR
jgi:hypothetical protein